MQMMVLLLLNKVFTRTDEWIRNVLLRRSRRAIRALVLVPLALFLFPSEDVPSVINVAIGYSYSVHSDQRKGNEPCHCEMQYEAN